MTATARKLDDLAPETAPDAIARPDAPQHSMVFEPVRGTVIARIGNRVVAKSNRAFAVRESYGAKSFDPVIYFPPRDVRAALLVPTHKTTVCPLKGTAAYFDIATEPPAFQAAWSYQSTHDFDRRLTQLECCVAFDRELVTIELSEDA